MSAILILTDETWLLCGGRDFHDQAMFETAMGDLVGMYGCPKKLVHGGAPGLDTMADIWAKRIAIEVVTCHADWDKHGKAAGPIRNEDMLIDHAPKRVIAFPGGKGTADMVRRARNRRGAIDVVEIRAA